MPHLAAARISRSAPPQEIVPKLLDHILLGCPDLEEGIAFVEKRLASALHSAVSTLEPARKTRFSPSANDRYLEIIAPDPNQPNAEDTRDLKKLTTPKIIGWAAHPGNLDEFAITLRKAGIEAHGPNPGSRKRPDGKTLSWRTLILQDDDAGLLPFFIEWGEGTTHPSVDAPSGCKLKLFEAASPDYRAVKLKADRMNLDLIVLGTTTAPHLRAEIIAPNGKASGF